LYFYYMVGLALEACCRSPWLLITSKKNKIHRYNLDILIHILVIIVSIYGLRYNFIYIFNMGYYICPSTSFKASRIHLGIVSSSLGGSIGYTNSYDSSSWSKIWSFPLYWMDLYSPQPL
jgi:hypothetical protein